MEILHKTVDIPADHKLTITLPSSIASGEAEIVLIVDGKQASTTTPSLSSMSNEEVEVDHTSSSTSSMLKDEALSKLSSLLNNPRKAPNEASDEAAETETTAEAAAPDSSEKP